jgi:cyanophycinase
MRLSIKFSLVWFISLVCLTAGISTLMAQCEGSEMLIAIGGGYGDTYDGFIAAALGRVQGDTLRIVVLPVSYATNADAISEEELQENLDAAENRRSQLEEACIAGVSEGMTCEVVLAPIFTRSDALDPANLEYFSDDVAAVYILGGDQTVAMQVLNGTPVEEALTSAYNCGVVIGGTSAGEAVQSRAMIAGYVGDFGPETGLKEGAVEVWNTDAQRGLPFGLTSVILEQHFWERGRLGRLLNAIAQPNNVHVGIGVDGYTAAQIDDNRILHNVFGLYSVGILDAETLGAAASASYKEDILSIRNVLFHILPPGEFQYDLETRQTSIAPTLTDADRNYDSLQAPDGAGTLMLASDLVGTASVNPEVVNPVNALAANPALTRFVELAGANPLLVLVYAENRGEISTNYAGALQLLPMGGADFRYQDDDLSEENLDKYAGIIIVADDPALIPIDQLSGIKDAWLAGAHILLDNAATGLAGAFYSAEGAIPEATDDEPYADTDAIQGAFIDGSTDIQPGLGLLNMMIEPRVLGDTRVGRMVALAYAHPDLLALGLSDGAALEINAEGATVLGYNGVFVLDLSDATLDKGTNDAYAFANGLIDVFAPGEIVGAN